MRGLDTYASLVLRDTLDPEILLAETDVRSTLSRVRCERTHQLQKIIYNIMRNKLKINAELD
jgi:hypothetical protein